MVFFGSVPRISRYCRIMGVSDLAAIVNRAQHAKFTISEIQPFIRNRLETPNEFPNNASLSKRLKEVSLGFYVWEMQLHHQEYGKGGKETIILLHGLLGSSRNWVTVGKLLAKDHHVVGLDLRNHGKSPHKPVMSYPTMVDDVCEWMDTQQLSNAHLVGHSMGGKVAMLMACNHPKRVSSMTIADIAPKDYDPHFKIAFDAMASVDPSRYRRIADVDNALADYVEDTELRQFLVTNLKRNEAGTFDWQVNLEGITRALQDISVNPLRADMVYTGPALLLHGEESDYVKATDHGAIMRHFPTCKIVEVPEARHNVHIENRHFFASEVSKLLRGE